MENTRVLISGASIAGPALAFWLHRYGFDVTVVEKAGEIRRGGQAVDFKGPVHMTVLERMGILDAVKEASVGNGDGIIVDASGRRIGTIPGAFGGGEINIPRGDLSHILYGLTAESCEYIFDDSIVSLTDTGSGMDVGFAHAPHRTVDLVVGADGIHSTVRKLAFGPEVDYVKHLGYYYVLADMETGDDDLMYNEPGLMAAVGGSKAPAFFVFASDLLPRTRDDVEAQKLQATEALQHAGWRVPELLARFRDSQEFYMDSISRVSADRFSSGRVALVGDSAYGNALGGFGTGLAVVGAYVLAGELREAGGDFARAYAEYESKFRAYSSVSQKINAGRLLAPSTRTGIRLRNFMFSALSRIGPLMRVIDRPAGTIRLDDYESAS